jgi:hypothetical protein
MIGRVDELEDEDSVSTRNSDCFYIPRPTITEFNNPFRDPSSHAEYSVLWHQCRCAFTQLDALGIAGRANKSIVLATLLVASVDTCSMWTCKQAFPGSILLLGQAD